jgi:hypothetical protein
MPTVLRNVYFREQSGKYVLALSFSGFDPEPTCDQQKAPDDAGALSC